MTHDQLVEKVALVLFNRMRASRKMHPVDTIGANNTPECNECRNVARAAIAAVYEAIREPTMGQVSAGRDAWVDDPARKSSTLYRAMIDASGLKP